MFAENHLQPAQGRILISEPYLPDNYFRKGVVLLAEHNEKGTIGFILNRALDISIQDAISDFPEYDGQVFFGGPVQDNQLYYVHTLGERIPDSFEISKGLWWLGDFETVKALIRSKEISKNEIRFFIGYSGWEPGQIDRELEDKSWIISEADTQLIFSANPKELWANALKKMGRHYETLTRYPEDFTQN